MSHSGKLSLAGGVIAGGVIAMHHVAAHKERAISGPPCGTAVPIQQRYHGIG